MDEREIGRFERGLPGPLFVAMGGLHGNEPAGIEATEIVLALLRENCGESNFRGRFVGLRGNLAALHAEERFIEEDLNRIWSTLRVGALTERMAGDDRAEEAQLRCILNAFQRLCDEPIGGQPPTQVVVLDLHSTSGPTTPFICMADTLQNRRVAFFMGVPVILGLEEALPGTMLDYMSEAGHVAMAFEGGSHSGEEIVRCHQAAICCGLVAGGLLDEQALDISRERKLLKEQVRNAPAIVEVLERHGTEQGDGFQMDPDWASFDRVAKGQRLAVDKDGVIHAKSKGRLLLPRYQDQGDDGFFISRDVQPFWLLLSACLRRVGAERLLPLLPGVERVDGTLRKLRVLNGRTRLGAKKVFHLFGYRRWEEDAAGTIFTRRPDLPEELKRRS